MIAFAESNFAKLIFCMCMANMICDKIYYYQKKCSNQKEYLLLKNHIFTTLRNRDGKYINLLGETHSKSDLETEECNKLIFNENVKNILIEQYKPHYLFNQIICYLDDIYFQVIIKQLDVQYKYKNISSIDVAYLSSKICYDLELNSYDELSDNLSFLSEILFKLAPFILFGMYDVAIKIMSITFLYNLLNVLIEYVPNYKTKLFFSKVFLIDRLVYRRDYIMATNIINYMNENKDNDDIPLCIFGSSHNEGIIYYLEQNGYEIVGNPRIF
jgi:hypothetical protein